MTDGIDGGTEDEIFDSGMSMGSHNDEVRSEDASCFNDGFPGAFPMNNLHLSFDALFLKTGGDAREVEAAFFHLSGFA